MKKNYYILVQSEMLEQIELSPRAKLLYGFIVSLSQQNGYCYATNKHFATKFGVCRKTITRSLKELSRAHYISTKMVVDASGNRLRYIYPLICPVGRTQTSKGQGRKSPAPLDKEVPDNKEKNNNKVNLSYESKFKPKID